MGREMLLALDREAFASSLYLTGSACQSDQSWG